MFFLIYLLRNGLQSDNIYGFYPDYTSIKEKTFQLIIPNSDQEEEYEYCSYQEIDTILGEESVRLDVLFQKIFFQVSLKEISENVLDYVRTEDANTIFYYFHSPVVYQQFSSIINTGEISNLWCYFHMFKRSFDKLKYTIKEPTILYYEEQNQELDPYLYKLDDYVTTRAFTIVSKNQYIFHDKASHFILKINAKRNAKAVKYFTNNFDEDALLYPPVTHFRITREAYQMFCTKGTFISDSPCTEEMVNQDQVPVTFVDIEEINEDYGPLIYA